VRVLTAPAGAPPSSGSAGAALVRAALWEPGEEHAPGTDDGPAAVVVQCRVCPLTEETP
jgi:hypothetical protein